MGWGSQHRILLLVGGGVRARPQIGSHWNAAGAFQTFVCNEPSPEIKLSPKTQLLSGGARA